MFIISYLLKNANLQKNNIIYQLTYYMDNFDPGSKYDITVYDDKVEISETAFCSFAVDCEETKYEKEILNYSKENINKLQEFIKKNLNTNNNINACYLNEYQNNVLRVLRKGEYFFETAVEEYEYKLIYSKTNSEEYNFYFKNDNSIIAKKLTIKDYQIEKIDTYRIEFKEENIKFLYKYIQQLSLESNGNIIYKNSTSYKDEENIFNSLINNNESYIDNINKGKELLYKLTYNGMNCCTPILRLYSDNSYEYYYVYSADYKSLIPKTGTFDYDIKKIIDSIDKYEPNSAGPYTITSTTGEKYITYNSNTELNNFLNSINVKLEMCCVEPTY